MAVYGDAFFTPGALDAAVAALDRPSLHRGRFAAAQLWKLTNVNGRYIELGQLLAPFLGDVEAVIPYTLVQVYRHLDAFRMPTREHNGEVDVPVWPEEVRGMPVRYAVNVENGNDIRRGRMMARATRRGYIDVNVEVRIEPLFSTAWTRRFRANWPMVLVHGELSVHPALERMVYATAATHFAIRNHNRERRAYWLARRRRMAAEMGLRVDRRGRVRNADDASTTESE
jgi:hypothetical protein